MTRKQRVAIYYRKTISALGGRVGKADRELIRLVCEREIARQEKIAKGKS